MVVKLVITTLHHRQAPLVELTKKHFNIDLSQPTFWQQTMKRVVADVNEYKQCDGLDGRTKSRFPDTREPTFFEIRFSTALKTH